MTFADQRPRLDHRSSMGSRARDIMLRTLAVIAGAVMLASAFVISLVFFAIAFAVVLIFGGYLWWKTRELRKQMRTQMSEMQEQIHPDRPQGDVIEGVVISRSETPDRQRPSER